MKTISLLQPWASLVAIGAKKIETRSWHTSYRGPLAIHASKALPYKNHDLIYREPFWTAFKSEAIDKGSALLPTGAVIATCKLVDCIKIIGRTSIAGKIVATRLLDRQEIEGNELAFGDYTPGRYAWILEDVRQLPEPIPATGKQRLWEWEVPEGLRL